MTPSAGQEATTDDVFLDGALSILQPKDGLRAGLDAVMLAASVQARVGARVLDAGAGVGVAGLAVARRCAWVHVTLLEKEAALAALARHNADRNGFGAAIDVFCADLTRPLSQLQPMGLHASSFDVVIANPPYFAEGSVRLSPRPLKSVASVLAAGDLDRWLRFLAAMAKPGGELALIHRADALSEVLAAIGNRFGAITVFPLFPREGEAAERIVVKAIKGSRGPLRLLPGMVLHQRDGSFTPAAQTILRTPAALEIRR